MIPFKTSITCWVAIRGRFICKDLLDLKSFTIFVAVKERFEENLI